MTTFYLKRPGQWSEDAEAVAGGDDGSWPSSTHATEDEWALSLPHSCDAWEIGIGTLTDVLEAARAFRAGLDEAIRRLERERAADGQGPARYAAARAAAARSLRAVEAAAAEAGLGAVSAAADWQAGTLECPSPFARAGIKPYDLVLPPPPPPWDGPWRGVPSSGCYEASFGMVHVRPGCRCAR